MGHDRTNAKSDGHAPCATRHGLVFSAISEPAAGRLTRGSSALSLLMRQSQPHERFALGGKAWLGRDGLVPVARKEGLTQRSQRTPRSSARGQATGSQRRQVIGASRGRVAALSSRLMRRLPVVLMRNLANRMPGIASQATQCAQAGTHKHFKRLKNLPDGYQERGRVGRRVRRRAHPQHCRIAPSNCAGQYGGKGLQNGFIDRAAIAGQ